MQIRPHPFLSVGRTDFLDQTMAACVHRPLAGGRQPARLDLCSLGSELGIVAALPRDTLPPTPAPSSLCPSTRLLGRQRQTFQAGHVQASPGAYSWCLHRPPSVPPLLEAGPRSIWVWRVIVKRLLGVSKETLDF